MLTEKELITELQEYGFFGVHSERQKNLLTLILEIQVDAYEKGFEAGTIVCGITD